MWWISLLAGMLSSRYDTRPFSTLLLVSQLLTLTVSIYFPWVPFGRIDVVKSRIQLADKPPATGIGYIGREVGIVVREQGM